MSNSIACHSDSIKSTANTTQKFYIHQLNNLGLVSPPSKQRYVAILDDEGNFQLGSLMMQHMRKVQHHLGSNFRGVIVRLQRDGRYTAVRNYWDPLNLSAFYEEQIIAINNARKKKHEPKLRTIHHYDSKGNNVTMEVTQLTPVAKVQNYPDKGSGEKYINGVIVRFKGGRNGAYYLAISSDKFKESAQQRWLKKKLYENQIKESQKQHHNFVPTKREILADKHLPDYLIKSSSGVAVQPYNGPNNPRGQPAKFERVTQCTPMCTVWNSSKQGQNVEKFYGAIVKLDNGCYRAVPESEFMVNVPCWAKHGVQDTSNLCLTQRLTGTIKLFGGDSGHKLICWCQTRKEWEWVPLGRIGQDAVNQTFAKRNRQAPLRLVLTQHGKRSPITTSCPPPLCVKNEKMELFMKLLHQKYSFGNGKEQGQDLVTTETIEEAPNVAELPEVKEIIEETNNAYEEHQKKLGKKKNASTFNRNALNIATLDLSVTFEIIKGNVKGSLGNEVNKAFGIKPEDKQDCHLYMNAMQSTVILPGPPHKKKKKVCREEGCTTYVHRDVSKHGTCWKHCPDNELKRSINAKRKTNNKEQQKTLPMCSCCESRRVPNSNHKRCDVCK